MKPAAGEPPAAEQLEVFAELLEAAQAAPELNMGPDVLAFAEQLEETTATTTTTGPKVEATTTTARPTPPDPQKQLGQLVNAAATNVEAMVHQAIASATAKSLKEASGSIHAAVAGGGNGEVARLKALSEQLHISMPDLSGLTGERLEQALQEQVRRTVEAQAAAAEKQADSEIDKAAAQLMSASKSAWGSLEAARASVQEKLEAVVNSMAGMLENITSWWMR